MNFSGLLFDVLALLWQALAIAVRLLRWLISQYFEAKKAKGTFLTEH